MKRISWCKWILVGLLIVLIVLSILIVIGIIPTPIEYHHISKYAAKEENGSYNPFEWALLSLINIIDDYAGAATVFVTVAIAYFTFKLVAISGLQARIGRDAANAARIAADAATQSSELAIKEFIVTHRPRIRVKHVRFDRQLDATAEIIVNVAIVNSGNAPLILREFRFATLIVPNESWLPAGLLDKRQPIQITNPPLSGGFTIVLPNCTDGRFLTKKGFNQIRAGKMKLYCVGDIEYQDEQVPTPRIMKTAFCRVFQHPSLPAKEGTIGRFVRVDDSDYEYED